MAEFPCSGPITVSARLAAGSLDVVAEERDNAVVTVEPYDGSDDSHEAVARTRVEMSGDTLHVVAPETGGGWGRKRSPRLRIGIRVPVDSSADLKASSATLNCHGRYATARLDAASGACAVEHVTGDAALHTASGEVQIGAVDRGLSVKAASGDVTVRYVGGDGRIDSASGDITVDEAAGSFRAVSASGKVRLGLVRRGSVRVDTVSGVASVGVAAGTGVWLDLRTLSGSTDSDLQFGAPAPPTGQDLNLKIRTVSGDIVVRRVVTDAAPNGTAATEEAPR